MPPSPLIIPSRIQHDNNWISHWWTGELLGDPADDFDMVFGTQVPGGFAGVFPIADKHYRLGNVGVMCRYTAAAPVAGWQLSLFNDVGLLVANFPFSTALAANAANRSCGSWTTFHNLSPCEAYHLRAVGTSTVTSMQVTAHTTLEVISDAI
jgi:hypothetical protein